jgi:hypothetical protein
MRCLVQQDQDGFTMFVCGGRRTPPPRCTVCEARPVTRLCDHGLDEHPRTQLRGGVSQAVTVRTTCDVGLCAQCAIRLGPDQDRCPRHAPPEYAERAARMVATAARLGRKAP